MSGNLAKGWELAGGEAVRGVVSGDVSGAVSGIVSGVVSGRVRRAVAGL